MSQTCQEKTIVLTQERLALTNAESKGTIHLLESPSAKRGIIN